MHIIKFPKPKLAVSISSVWKASKGMCCKEPEITTVKNSPKNQQPHASPPKKGVYLKRVGKLIKLFFSNCHYPSDTFLLYARRREYGCTKQTLKLGRDFRYFNNLTGFCFRVLVKISLCVVDKGCSVKIHCTLPCVTVPLCCLLADKPLTFILEHQHAQIGVALHLLT